VPSNIQLLCKPAKIPLPKRDRFGGMGTITHGEFDEALILAAKVNKVCIAITSPFFFRLPPEFILPLKRGKYQLFSNYEFHKI